jgi:transposase
MWTSPSIVDNSGLLLSLRESHLSSHRYTPEFKDEAVRQIVDRGYSVTEVSQRLGVSSHSLYKWAKAAKPDKTEKHAAELIEATAAKYREAYKRLTGPSP